MVDQKTITRVRDIFRDVMDSPDITLDKDLTREQVQEWDSLNHINLVAAIESDFNILMDEDEIMGVHTVGDIYSILERHGAGSS